jgi:hypothetical protein
LLEADDSVLTSNETLKPTSNNTVMAVMVKKIGVEYTKSSPSYLTDVNGTLYFTADDPIQGRELWKSEDTEVGTMLANIPILT